MRPPDFDGFGLLNLMATLERGLGGESRYPSLPALGLSRVMQARSVVLLVIDGLGESRLEKHAPDLLEHRLCSLSSVFPSATAPAVTTLLTGVPPAAHGITGWKMHVAELDRVMTFLPFRARDGAPVDATPGQLLGAQTFCERITDGTVDTVLVSPRDISDSPVNRTFGGPADRRAYDDLEGMVRTVAGAAQRAHKRRYIYAYWGLLDSLSHKHGAEAEVVLSHLRDLSDAVRHLADQLIGYDSLLLITADHGFMDIEHVTLLSDHPQLAECLQRPLCGEPRAAFCYLRPGAEARFVDYVQSALGEHFELHRSATLVEQGFFGPAPHDSRLASRVGDFVLLGRQGSVLVDRLPHEKPFTLRGMHGGLTDDEMRVPLLAFGR